MHGLSIIVAMNLGHIKPGGHNMEIHSPKPEPETGVNIGRCPSCKNFTRQTDDGICDECMSEMEYDADAPAYCQSCGEHTKRVTGRLKNGRFLRCDECGADYFQPIENGVVYTSKEMGPY